MKILKLIYIENIYTKEAIKYHGAALESSDWFKNLKAINDDIF